MIRYSASQLQPGMVAAEAVYSSRGQLIVDTGTILTTAMISRLGFYGIYQIGVQEPAGEEKDASAAEEPTETYSQHVKQSPEFQVFQEEYTEELDTLQNSFTSLIQPEKGQVDTSQIIAQTADLLKPGRTTIELFDMLHNMRQIDDSIYAHSLNVALIAHTMGQWLHFSESDLSLLMLSGLLHDIGKTSLPEELLNKPGKYSKEEFGIVKKHPLMGYKILMDLPLDDHVKKAALMHHERCDGSGYPRGMVQDQLDDFAMIIAIADVYDAMTAARSYRAPLCPFQVIGAFEKEGLQKYHPKYILTFLERIANTYEHNQVMLNNGQVATVVMINKQQLTKPLVQLENKTIIDLSTRNDLEIVSIV